MAVMVLSITSTLTLSAKSGLSMSPFTLFWEQSSFVLAIKAFEAELGIYLLTTVGVIATWQSLASGCADALNVANMHKTIPNINFIG